MTAEDTKLTFIGLCVLKLLDLEADDGGLEFPINLPHELAPLEPVLDRLALDGLVDLDRRGARYLLTQRGIDYLGTIIDEAESYVEEFGDLEADQIVNALAKRNVDPLRVRFLWGWYQGEFDDPVVFQQRRGSALVESDWAAYLMSDAFFEELSRDLTPS